MKLCRIITSNSLSLRTIVTIITLQLSSQVSAVTSSGQEILDATIITPELVDEPLMAVFDIIEKQADCRFAFSEKQVSKHKVTLEKGIRTLRETLKLILPPSLNYKVMDDDIVIHKIERRETIQKIDLGSMGEHEPRELAMKRIDVTGKVLNELDQPLPGAAVIEKGTNNGTVTDVDGNFTLQVNEDAVLMISFIGYAKKEVPVNGRSVIDVQMEVDVSQLGEVVINAGYYTVTEKTKTGSIVRVSRKEIEKQPVSNPLQALTGRMPGVYIQQNTGVPGGGLSIQIRGQNSLRSDANNPLYIVNGVPFTSAPLGSEIGGTIVRGGNPLSSLNPQDIESIEILKDADATAIYGSRGANGVVLITTKKGKAGETKVDINVYSGVGKVSNKMDLLNRQQYLEMRNEAFVNDGLEPGSIYPDHDLLFWDTTRFTDWQDVLIGGTANVTNAQATVSGGSASTQFLIGTGFYNETTVFPGDFNYQKYSTNFNLNHTSTNQKFNVNLSTNFVIENNNLLRSDLTSSALTLPPVSPAAFDEEGNLNWEEGTWSNPFASLLRKYKSRTSNLIVNTTISYQLLDGLEFKSNLGYTELLLKENRVSPAASLNPFQGLEASSDFGENSIKTWIIEPQLHYQLSTERYGTLNFLVGSTFQQNLGNNQVLFTTGYSSDALLNDIQSATNVSVQATNNFQYRYTALFGRINYDFDSKYILNLTGRRDGSSRFGPGRQFANFGAIGASWIFTNEDFVKNNLSFLSFGKVRASYGTTGSDQIGNYGFLELWSSTQFAYDGIQGLIPENLFNAEYGWEKNKKLEAAIDLGFLNERIQFSMNYFINRSSNQLVGTPLANTTGFPSILSNFAAEVENKGIELELNTTNVKINAFNWITSLNVTVPRNKLISYPNIENSAFRFQYDVGKSLYIQKRYHFLGVDPQSGISTYEDVNADGNFTPADDYRGLKEVTQDYYGGVSNSFNYKGFQLDVFFQFVKQTGFNYLASFSDLPGTAGNQPTLVMDRWQKAGDRTNIQQFSQAFGDAFFAHFYGTQSDNAIGDASFIRLKNVFLSYQFPAALTERVHIKRLRIYLQGQNLLTFTRYQGLDPETQSSALPPLRMLTGGLQVTL